VWRCQLDRKAVAYTQGHMPVEWLEKGGVKLQWQALGSVSDSIGMNVR